MSIHEKIRQIRTEKGLTMSEVALYSGLAQSTLSHIESGKATPNIDTLIKIASVLGVRPEELLAGSDVPSKAERLELGGPMLEVFRLLTLDERRALIEFLRFVTQGRN